MVTERLLARAGSKVSGQDRGANIYAMPDLGLPHNVQRIHGGMFTGAVYQSETNVPFVPVDTTVNACGVSVFRLNTDIPSETDFHYLIGRAIETTRESLYHWNFASGNHFIIYGEVRNSSTLPDGNYVALHSSAAEFKKQSDKGLYPTHGNWYADDIEVLEDEQTGRYIRYIQGKTAERFIAIAQSLTAINQERHRYFASAVFGSRNLGEEILNEQHYGMPTESSVAIGCHWARNRLLPLLTAPGKPIFIVQPIEGQANDVQVGDQRLLLFPHGLGKQSVDPLHMEFGHDSLTVNGRTYGITESLQKDKGFQLRNFAPEEAAGNAVPSIIASVLEQCPADIVAKFDQIYSYHAGSSGTSS